MELFRKFDFLLSAHHVTGTTLFDPEYVQVTYCTIENKADIVSVKIPVSLYGHVTPESIKDIQEAANSNYEWVKQQEADKPKLVKATVHEEINIP